MKRWIALAGIALATGVGVYAGELPESLKKTLDYTQKTNFFVVSNRFEAPVEYTDVYFRSVADDGTILGRCDHFSDANYIGTDFFLPSGSFHVTETGTVSDLAEANPVLSGKVFQTLTETISSDAYVVEDEGATRGRGVKSKLFLAAATDRAAAPDGVAEYRLLAGSDDAAPFLYRIWKLDPNGNDIERIDLRGAVLNVKFDEDVFALPAANTDMPSLAEELRDRYLPTECAVDIKEPDETLVALQVIKDNIIGLVTSLVILLGGIVFFVTRTQKAKKTKA